MGRLDDRSVVITGTSRGLGRALAEVFTREGARVTGASRAGGIDVSREEDVVRLFQEAVAAQGKVDVLVNNAGVLTPRKPLAEVSLQEWQASLAVNLNGVFLCTREALRHMLPRKEGLIINVASGVSTRAAPTWGPYAAAKWAVQGLTRLVAQEARDAGVRIVGVNPARTRTAMRAAAYPEEDPATVKSPEETAEFFAAVAAGEVPFESGDLLEYRPLD